MIGGRGAGGWSLSDTWILLGTGRGAGSARGPVLGRKRRDGALGLGASRGHPIQ